MPDRADDDARQIDALDRLWDALAADGAAIPTDDDRLDPTLEHGLRRLHDLGADLAPDPTFLRALREDLTDMTTASPAGVLPGPFPSLTPNGRTPHARPARQPPRRRPSLGPWGRVGDIAAAALLALTIIAGTLVGTGGFPAFLGADQNGGTPVDALVSMEGGNPGRTGEQPGPGPEEEPGVRWSTYVGAGTTSPVVADGIVYVAGDTGSLAAYDAATGDERWRTRLGGSASVPTVFDGSIFLGLVSDSETSDSAGFVEAYDAATGARRWSAPTGSFGGASPVVVDGVVYGMGDAEVFAFDADTGDQLWHRVLPTGVCGCTGPGLAVANGEVFAPGGTTLYALDAETGRERWRFETDGDYLTTPVVAGGRVIVGDAVWLSEEGNNKVGEVHAVEAGTGDRLWTATAVYIGSPPAVAGGLVFVPTRGLPLPDETAATPEATYREITEELVALDLETGRYRWRVPLPITASQPTVAADTVFLSANSYQTGYVAAFDAASGDQRWLREVRGSVAASPAVTGGSLFFTTYHNGALFALGAVAAASPAAGVDPLLGEPCEAEPRVDADRPASGQAPAAVFGQPIWNLELLTDADLPEGDPVPAATVAAIEEAVNRLRRCADSDPAIQASFYSDDFFRRVAADLESDEPWPMGDAAVVDGWEVSPFAPISVRDARELADGKVGALVEGGSNPTFIIFAEQDGRWLIDEIAYPVLTDDEAAAATPTP